MGGEVGRLAVSWNGCRGSRHAESVLGVCILEYRLQGTLSAVMGKWADWWGSGPIGGEEGTVAGDLGMQKVSSACVYSNIGFKGRFLQ